MTFRSEKNNCFCGFLPNDNKCTVTQNSVSVGNRKHCYARSRVVLGELAHLGMTPEPIELKLSTVAAASGVLADKTLKRRVRVLMMSYKYNSGRFLFRFGGIHLFACCICLFIYSCRRHY